MKHKIINSRWKLISKGLKNAWQCASSSIHDVSMQDECKFEFWKDLNDCLTFQEKVTLMDDMNVQDDDLKRSSVLGNEKG